jgi:hypothetical protein
MSDFLSGAVVNHAHFKARFAVSSQFENCVRSVRGLIPRLCESFRVVGNDGIYDSLKLKSSRKAFGEIQSHANHPPPHSGLDGKPFAGEMYFPT